MRALWLALAVLPSIAAAQVAPPATAPVTTLRTVEITGKQPGPGLWKVSKDGHAMWVFGTLSPLPKRMEWTSDEVERAVARAGEVVTAPSVSVMPAGSRLKALFLLPSLLKARNNPGKERLQDVLPPETYARWLVLKKRYLGRDGGVEKRRPLMAAGELEREAMDDAGLTFKTRVYDVVEKAAKRNDVPITRPTIEIEIPDAKALIKDFQKTSLDDIACFEKTLQRLENDIETTKLRANAWALGEVEILRTLPFTDNRRACADAILETTIARRAGLQDIEGRVRTLWLDAVKKAIATHEHSFGLLPMGLILGEEAWLQRLEAQGYTVEAPAPRP